MKNKVVAEISLIAYLCQGIECHYQNFTGSGCFCTWRWTYS